MNCLIWIKRRSAWTDLTFPFPVSLPLLKFYSSKRNWCQLGYQFTRPGDRILNCPLGCLGDSVRFCPLVWQINCIHLPSSSYFSLSRPFGGALPHWFRPPVKICFGPWDTNKLNTQQSLKSCWLPLLPLLILSHCRRKMPGLVAGRRDLRKRAESAWLN